MKYFTKDFYQVMVLADYLDYADPIEAREYSQEEIQALHQELEDEIVEELRIVHNMSPVDLQEKELKDMGLTLDDIKIWDYDQTGEKINERRPQSSEEFREYLAKDLEDEMAEFEARPPFDEEASRARLQEESAKQMAQDMSFLPDYILDQVDQGLLVLGLIPSHLYSRLEEDLEAELNSWLEEAEEIDALLEEGYDDLPEEIADIYSLATDRLIDLEEEDGDLIMLTLGADDDDGFRFRRQRFFQAEILDYEDFMDSEERLAIAEIEVFSKGSSYEAHFLIQRDFELFYLTLAFQDAQGIDNYLDFE